MICCARVREGGVQKQVHCLCIPFPLPSKTIRSLNGRAYRHSLVWWYNVHDNVHSHIVCSLSWFYFHRPRTPCLLGVSSRPWCSCASMPKTGTDSMSTLYCYQNGELSSRRWGQSTCYRVYVTVRAVGVHYFSQNSNTDEESLVYSSVHKLQMPLSFLFPFTQSGSPHNAIAFI